MRTFNIGLDFGTYQSKACIYDAENNTHEFFVFADKGSFCFPSKVILKSNHTFEYGDSKHGKGTEYCYFKIAAAEDEEFHAETFDETKTSKTLYNANEFQPFTPEFLSVIYLTYLLFEIKQAYTKKSTAKKSTGKFLRRLIRPETNDNQIKFTVQLGIPTEWSHLKNLRRKRKFENILLMAELLQERYSYNSFLNARDAELMSAVREIYQGYCSYTVDQFTAHLDNMGLSVFPETAAGLTFIIKTNQLLPGHYAIMDIGGGSTDISFFSLELDNHIKYLASESYLIAANDVYRYFAKAIESNVSLAEVEERVKTIIQNAEWENNGPLTEALLHVKTELDKMVYKLFNKRVVIDKHGRVRRNMCKKYNEQPMLLYGGGSRLPGLDNGQVLIHDNGIKIYSMFAPCTYMEKQQIERYTSIVNVLPNDNSWKSDLSLLVVALGLSYIKTVDFANWIKDDEYQSLNWEEKHEVPHPSNEGYYIYDVLSSNWN